MHRSLILVLLALLLLTGCGGGEAHEGSGRRGHAGGPPGGAGGDRRGATAVPVEVTSVERRDISSYIETNGTLEAENEVDLVARVAAPVVELLVEEGMAVRRGQTLLRLEQVELQAQLEISRVSLEEATLVYERAKKLYAETLISEEAYEQARAAFESAMAQLEANRIQLGYTNVAAPFDGLIITRYVDYAQQVSVNTPLFRISDFDPLLCPIQVPERELASLSIGQPAHLRLEPWPDREFAATVLRVSPVVNAATGTIKVTLEIDADKRLRPGMFARVFLETDKREGVLVIPKSALSLESIGDTVYVADGTTASRREVSLGFREGDFVEVTSGVAEGEAIIVLGQDGLSDGTPVEILRGGGERTPTEAVASSEPPPTRPGQRGGRPGGPGRRGGPPDFSAMNPEQLERAREFMRARGMTDEQIDARVRGDGRQEPSTQ
jgi:membrane fusion protein (multidrug efflux system)